LTKPHLASELRRKLSDLRPLSQPAAAVSRSRERKRLPVPLTRRKRRKPSAKAEAKLVKALDYLVAINDHSDNPGQKWFINESILASLTGCFRPAIKKFVETQLLYQSG
jgi:hypothetical protein